MDILIITTGRIIIMETHLCFSMEFYCVLEFFLLQDGVKNFSYAIWYMGSHVYQAVFDHLTLKLFLVNTNSIDDSVYIKYFVLLLAKASQRLVCSDYSVSWQMIKSTALTRFIRYLKHHNKSGMGKSLLQFSQKQEFKSAGGSQIFT